MACEPTMSLFAVGLDSIKAVVIAKLLRKFNIFVSATDIIRNPTIRSISNHSSGPSPQQRQHIESDLPEPQSLRGLKRSGSVRLCRATELQSGMLAWVS